MHPFLDASKLSDEEIIQRLGRAYQYMNAQVALGHAPTVHSIKEVIQTLEDERRVRMQRIIDEENKRRNPEPNKPIDLGNLEE